MNRVEINPNIFNLKESATLAINTQIRELRKQGQDVVHFGFGQSPFEVPFEIQEALKSHSQKKEYLPTTGLLELKQAIRSYLLREMNQDFKVENIFIGPGSKELLFQALFCLQGPVIIPGPSWVSYKPQVDIRSQSNVIIVSTSLKNNFKLMPDELERACQKLKENQKILILNNPSNPTGTLYTAEDLKAIAEVCERYNIVVISDEIYSQIVFHGKKFSGMANHYPDKTIVTGGLSKGFSAGGYRLGFIAIPRNMSQLCKPLTSIFSETFSSVASPVQYAGVRAFNESPSISEYVKRCRDVHEACGDYIYQRLSMMGVESSQPEGAFYLFIRFEKFKEAMKKKGIQNDLDLCEYLLNNYGVALLPGSEFYYPTERFAARLATVDYDGAQVMAALQSGALLGESFVETHCPHISKGMDWIEDFVRSL